jgi:translation initiation factor 4E
MAEVASQSDSTGITTPTDFNKLSTPWSLWVMSQHGKVSKDHWQANQTKAIEVSTVEDFWRMMNNIHPPSKIASADYSLFRQGITPAWEDKICQRGGRWVAKSDKSKGLDEAWQNVVMHLIGEQFSPLSNTICGTVVSSRRSGVKLAIWVATRNMDEIMAIGKLFKECVQPLYQGRTDTIPSGPISTTISFDFFGEPPATETGEPHRPIEL